MKKYTLSAFFGLAFLSVLSLGLTSIPTLTNEVATTASDFDWAMFHAIFWPILFSILCGLMGFFFYWKDKKRKEKQENNLK